MADCYLGEIRLFAGLWTPVGWHLCDGSLLTISNNEALYTLLGTTYGGDGRTNFGLPDLRSRVPIGQGQGNNLTARVLGQMGGEEEVVLNAGNLPVHSHAVNALDTPATTSNPSGAMLATVASPRVFYTQSTGATTVQVDPRVVGAATGYQPTPLGHPNIMASMGLNFIIALEGIFPTQN